MGKKRKKPLLKIVFDTNVIFNGTSSFLLNKKVSDFITENSKFSDLEISWYLPDIVVMERIFQMNEKGYELLQSVKKLEILLGHNLNITEEIIGDRINTVIQKQLEKYNINKLDLDIKDVNWKRVINNSAFRNPPFENSQKEKGFRDALILENLEQLVLNSPKTSSICKIVFVCNDNLLNEAAKERLNEYNNIRYVNGLTSLKGLLNVLVSEIEENIVNEISETASKMFFIPQNENTIYYKENIRDKIKDNYNDKLSELPDKIATKVETGTWYIAPVNFVEKVNQRIRFSSEITIDLQSYKTDYKEMTNPLTQSSLGILPNNPFLGSYGISGSTLIGRTTKIPENIEYIKGQSKYEIIWSVTYGVNKKIINPKIEKINFKGNEWDNE